MLIYIWTDPVCIFKYLQNERLNDLFLELVHCIDILIILQQWLDVSVSIHR